MARRSTPTPDARVVELGRRMGELACELAGPGATFEEVELFVDAIRSGLVVEVLREELGSSVSDTPPPGSGRVKSRRH